MAVTFFDSGLRHGGKTNRFARLLTEHTRYDLLERPLQQRCHDNDI